MERFVRVLQFILLAFWGLSCTQIVVKVSKKSKVAVEDHNVVGSSEDSTREPRIQDFEYYLMNLDDLRNVTGEELYRRLKDNWRHIFRREFRNFRQIVIDSAKRSHQYQDSLVSGIGKDECRTLKHADLRTFDGNEFLESILEASFLANLSIEAANKLNPGLIDQLELIAHLILFELGMRAEGQSQVEIDGSLTTMTSSIIWKVDPELPDLPELTELDDYAVRMNFVRVLQRSKSDSFTLQVEFAKGLFDDPSMAAEYRMELQHRWREREHLGDVLEITMRIWHEKTLNYSRMIALEQQAKFSQVFLFRDTIRYQLKGEDERQAVLDFAKLQKCAFSEIQMIVPGLIGMQPEAADSLLRTLQLKPGQVEDMTDGDAERIVIRQDPVPGTKVLPGSLVDMVFGTWADFETPPQSSDNEEGEGEEEELNDAKSPSDEVSETLP